ESNKICWQDYYVKTAINQVIVIVSLPSNISNLHANSTTYEFVLLKALHVQMHLSNAPVIKEVLWQPPIMNWMKCNSDGASAGKSSCRGIFRNFKAIFKGVFAINLGLQPSSFAEFMGVMLSIGITHHNGWKQL
ncbi:ribonuclease H, partial [Trifolium pratense]